MYHSISMDVLKALRGLADCLARVWHVCANEIGNGIADHGLSAVRASKGPSAFMLVRGPLTGLLAGVLPDHFRSADSRVLCRQARPPLAPVHRGSSRSES